MFEGTARVREVGHKAASRSLEEIKKVVKASKAICPGCERRNLVEVKDLYRLLGSR